MRQEIQAFSTPIAETNTAFKKELNKLSSLKSMITNNTVAMLSVAAQQENSVLYDTILKDQC